MHVSFACLAQALHKQPRAYVRANDRDAPAARQLLADALQAVRGLALTYWQDPTTYLKLCGCALACVVLAELSAVFHKDFFDTLGRKAYHCKPGVFHPNAFRVCDT